MDTTLTQSNNNFPILERKHSRENESKIIIDYIDKIIVPQNIKLNYIKQYAFFTEK